MTVHRMRDWDHLIATLRATRQSRGLSLAGVAIRMGRKPSAGKSWLWQVERGHKCPQLDSVFDIADALGLDVALVPRERT